MFLVLLLLTVLLTKERVLLWHSVQRSRRTVAALLVACAVTNVLDWEERRALELVWAFANWLVNCTAAAAVRSGSARSSLARRRRRRNIFAVVLVLELEASRRSCDSKNVAESMCWRGMESTWGSMAWTLVSGVRAGEERLELLLLFCANSIFLMTIASKFDLDVLHRPIVVVCELLIVMDKKVNQIKLESDYRRRQRRRRSWEEILGYLTDIVSVSRRQCC